MSGYRDGKIQADNDWGHVWLHPFPETNMSGHCPKNYPSGHTPEEFQDTILKFHMTHNESTAKYVKR